MTYRIRFQQPGRPREDEALIEANSPNEALVKFRCIRRFGVDPAYRSEHITSVSVDENRPVAL